MDKPRFGITKYFMENYRRDEGTKNDDKIYADKGRKIEKAWEKDNGGEI